jgi:O-antigen/teichoic acid export membrane protein
LSKGIVLVVNALSIPITVRYLGPEQFGVWITISTTLSILLVLDLGIASALTNLISEAYAKESKELASRYAASAFWMMVFVAAGLGAVGALVWPQIPWASVFHLNDAEQILLSSHAVAVGYVVFLLGLPAGLAAKMLGGYQELRIANIFSAAGSVANLFAVILVAHWHGGLPILIGFSSGATVLANLVCLLWLWSTHKPWLIPRLHNWDYAIVRRLMGGGSELFILQLTGLIVFNSDNFVIAHYLGPIDVTPYSVTWKLVSYGAALQIIVTPALWPAYAEAYVRGDFPWIRRALRNVMASTMGAALTACFVMAVWGKVMIKVWAGDAAVPSQALILAMCLWVLISVFMANTSTILLATGETKMQAWLSVLAAVINLVLSIWLVQRIGSIGVIIATILSYVLVLVGPQTWKVIVVLRSKNSSMQPQKANA